MRGAPFWTLPKGRFKPDENPIETVQREVLEETGIAGAVEDPIRQVTYQIVKRGQPCHKVVTNYLLRAEAGTLCPDKRDSLALVRWFAVPRALGRIHRQRVREVAHYTSTLLQRADIEH